MVSVTAPDATVPGFVTVIESVPALTICAELIVAVSCVDDTKFVPRFTPLAWTMAPDTKFAPFTVSVNDGPPATTVDGLMERITGVAANAMTLSARERARTAAVRPERMRSD